MNSNDWGFAIGSLGDPLADIYDWMLPPRPARHPEPKEDETTVIECPHCGGDNVVQTGINGYTFACVVCCREVYITV